MKACGFREESRKRHLWHEMTRRSTSAFDKSASFPSHSLVEQLCRPISATRGFITIATRDSGPRRGYWSIPFLRQSLGPHSIQVANPRSNE